MSARKTTVGATLALVLTATSAVAAAAQESKADTVALGPAQTAISVNDATTEAATASFAYSGAWQAAVGDAAKYLGDDHYSDTAGSRYDFRFVGTQISLFGALAANHGQSAVTLDGSASGVIDQYAAVRRDNVEVYRSPLLPFGEHTVTVRVDGRRNPSSTGSTVSVDRAVVKTITAAATPPTPTIPVPALVDRFAPRVVFHESGDGPDASPYASPSLNAVHPLWHVEGGSAPLTRSGGKIAKVHSAQFHRVFSQHRVGGPGNTVRISYRARATAIRDRAGSSIVEGAKIGLKFPMPESLTGYGKDDPRSVYGKPGSSSSPGSYQFLTGLSEGGYLEVSRNAYGSGGYTFFSNKRVGYTPGTWMDIVVTVEWLDASTMRIRYWHNATGSGTPVYEATDTNSPFAGEPGFLWLRTDDTDWEYDYLTVEEMTSRST